MVDELRHKYLLKVLLKVSGLKKSTYEYYKSQKHINACKRKETKDSEVLEKIKKIFIFHKSRYGYRRMHLELNKTIKINHKRVQRIMRINNLKGIQPKARYHSYKGDNGFSKKNLLLYSTHDSVKKKKFLKGILKQINQMKNGQLMYQNFIYLLENYIYHQYLICLIVQ